MFDQSDNFLSESKGLTEDDVRSIVRDEISRVMADFRIVGPGVSGQGNQWVINPKGSINGTLDCSTNKLTGTVDLS